MAVKASTNHRIAIFFVLLLSTVSGCGPMIFPRRSIIEPLVRPQHVLERRGAILKFADGREISLPGISIVKEPAPFLDAAVEHGVETKDDRLIGQLKIWHWCGNDMVGNHRARVDLSYLAIFTGEGTPSRDVTVSRERVWYSSNLKKYGWNYSEYLEFKQ